MPPTFNNKNYPSLTENITKHNTDRSPTIIEDTPLPQQPTPDITIIEETPASQLPSSTDENIEFLSPPMVSMTAITTSTPKTIDTSTPTIDHSTTQMLINRHSFNKEIIQPKIYKKKGKIISQEKIQDTALKMTQKLAKLNFRDTGFLSNATQDERNRIIALAMYYQIGRFDPSNTFVKNYKNKDGIELAKQYTEQKLLKKQMHLYTFTPT